MLDSGSEVSIVGSDVDVLRESATIHDSTDFRYIVTANGSTSPVIGYMHLPVTVEERTRVVKFYVIPGITSMILGINFWKAFGIAPDILDLLVRTKTVSMLQPAEVSTPEFAVNRLHPYDSLSADQRLRADEIFKLYEGISAEKQGLGCTHLITHHIDTGSSTPIKQRYYMLSPEKLAELNRQLDEMIRMDVVEESNSPWNNPVTMAPKSGGEWRFCLDSRKLNEVSKHDAYPLPYITHILDQLRDCKFLSSIDLKSAFWQIPLGEESKEKTAFTVPGRGLFHFKRMCFGLTSAPATQQRLMDRLFGPEFGNKIFIYLDDIVVLGSSFEEHLDLLKRVLERLKFANLTVNLAKCCFFRRQLKYLGYVVDDRGLRTDPDKIRSIVDFPTPTCRKDVKRFLGTASYYRRFIRNFSNVAGPLNALTSTRKGAPPFEWNSKTQEAFDELKNALTSAPVLACPDFSQPFIVHSDASEHGVGGMLTQVLDGQEHPIAYCSRSLNAQERNYSATEKEALAVVHVVEHFRPYLEGSRPFRIITDHASLKWFLNLKNPSGRLERWGCRLSPYNFTIEHRKGSENVVPDALSRAVPVADISTPTQDPWYENVLHRCLKSPQSCPNFQVLGDRLYRYTRGKNVLAKDFEWKEVVPVEQRDSVLKENHSDPRSAHLGIAKTHKRIGLRYYWPGMYKDVVSYVSKCVTCQAYKHSNQSTPGFMGSPKVCSRPFQCISIDLVGPLPLSRSQNTFLLVVVCVFSKYCLLFPLRRATGKVIAQRLEDHVFLTHGVPQTLLADNGPQFTGQEVQALFSKYKIPHVHFSPVYCPQVNTVERYNRTVITAISSLVGSDHRSWDVNIAKIQFALNSAVNETTKFSPFMLVHGREAVIDGSVYANKEIIDEIIFSSRDEYAFQMGELKPIFERVRKELSKAHERNAKYYNRRRRPLNLNVGDYVWKRTYRLSDAKKYFTSKLAPKYERCRIVKKLSPLVFELEDGRGKHIGKWHIKDFKVDSTL